MMDGGGMGTMMTWMMGIGMLGWVLVIALLATIVVLLVIVRKGATGDRTVSRPPGRGSGELRE